MRQELGRLAQWRGELDAMRMGASLGALHLGATTLKASLLPIVTTAQMQVPCCYHALAHHCCLCLPGPGQLGLAGCLQARGDAATTCTVPAPHLFTACQ